MIRAHQPSTGVPANSPPPPTAEELILAMSGDELEELLHNIGFEPSPQMARGIQSLVRELGSLDAAIDTLKNLPVTRRAA